MRHFERHRTGHIGWLRAAVLGANDGLISTASLVLGVAAAGTGRAAILIAGIAGINPHIATTGSVTFSKYAVQFDLQYEFDSRQIPSNDSYGYFPQNSFFPLARSPA